VIPDGADPTFTPRPAAEVDAGLRAFGLRRGEYLMFLSTIEPRKNLLRILEALERTPPEVGPLAVAGAQGWNDRDIVDALTRLEAAGRVRRLGYVADDARPLLLAGARAFVYPSLYEGFGLPALEALACGTPLLTSNVSSLPEVVGDAALLVDPRDVAAIADGLTRLWHDDRLRDELRARGLARAREFTWERTARLTLAVYERVLDTSAQR
jgi:alpha-1,3-rhamnosyl/mannosyltransferase